MTGLPSLSTRRRSMTVSPMVMTSSIKNRRLFREPLVRRAERSLTSSKPCLRMLSNITLVNIVLVKQKKDLKPFSSKKINSPKGEFILIYAYRLITTYLLTLVKLYRKNTAYLKGPGMLCWNAILAPFKAVLLLQAKTPTQSRVSQAFIAPDAILNHRLTLVKHFKK